MQVNTLGQTSSDKKSKTKKKRSSGCWSSKRRQPEETSEVPDQSATSEQVKIITDELALYQDKCQTLNEHLREVQTELEQMKEEKVQKMKEEKAQKMKEKQAQKMKEEQEIKMKEEEEQKMKEEQEQKMKEEQEQKMKEEQTVKSEDSPTSLVDLLSGTLDFYHKECRRLTKWHQDVKSELASLRQTVLEVQPVVPSKCQQCWGILNSSENDENPAKSSPTEAIHEEIMNTSADVKKEMKTPKNDVQTGLNSTFINFMRRVTEPKYLDYSPEIQISENLDNNNGNEIKTEKANDDDIENEDMSSLEKFMKNVHNRKILNNGEPELEAGFPREEHSKLLNVTSLNDDIDSKSSIVLRHENGEQVLANFTGEYDDVILDTGNDGHVILRNKNGNHVQKMINKSTEAINEAESVLLSIDRISNATSRIRRQPSWVPSIATHMEIDLENESDCVMQLYAPDENGKNTRTDSYQPLNAWSTSATYGSNTSQKLVDDDAAFFNTTETPSSGKPGVKISPPAKDAQTSSTSLQKQAKQDKMNAIAKKMEMGEKLALKKISNGINNSNNALLDSQIVAMENLIQAQMKDIAMLTSIVSEDQSQSDWASVQYDAGLVTGHFQLRGEEKLEHLRRQVKANNDKISRLNTKLKLINEAGVREMATRRPGRVTNPRLDAKPSLEHQEWCQRYLSELDNLDLYKKYNHCPAPSENYAYRLKKLYFDKTDQDLGNYQARDDFTSNYSTNSNTNALPPRTIHYDVIMPRYNVIRTSIDARMLCDDVTDLESDTKQPKSESTKILKRTLNNGEIETYIETEHDDDINNLRLISSSSGTSTAAQTFINTLNYMTDQVQTTSETESMDKRDSLLNLGQLKVLKNSISGADELILTKEKVNISGLDDSMTEVNRLDRTSSTVDGTAPLQGMYCYRRDDIPERNISLHFFDPVTKRENEEKISQCETKRSESNSSMSTDWWLETDSDLNSLDLVIGSSSEDTKPDQTRSEPVKDEVNWSDFSISHSYTSLTSSKWESETNNVTSGQYVQLPDDEEPGPMEIVHVLDSQNDFFTTTPQIQTDAEESVPEAAPNVQLQDTHQQPVVIEPEISTEIREITASCLEENVEREDKSAPETSKDPAMKIDSAETKELTDFSKTSASSEKPAEKPMAELDLEDIENLAASSSNEDITQAALADYLSRQMRADWLRKTTARGANAAKENKAKDLTMGSTVEGTSNDGKKQSDEAESSNKKTEIAMNENAGKGVEKSKSCEELKTKETSKGEANCNKQHRSKKWKNKKTCNSAKTMETVHVEMNPLQTVIAPTMSTEVLQWENLTEAGLEGADAVDEDVVEEELRQRDSDVVIEQELVSHLENGIFEQARNIEAGFREMIIEVVEGNFVAESGDGEVHEEWDIVSAEEAHWAREAVAALGREVREDDEIRDDADSEPLVEMSLQEHPQENENTTGSKPSLEKEKVTLQDHETSGREPILETESLHKSEPSTSKTQTANEHSLVGHKPVSDIGIMRMSSSESLEDQLHEELRQFYLHLKFPPRKPASSDEWLVSHFDDQDYPHDSRHHEHIVWSFSSDENLHSTIPTNTPCDSQDSGFKSGRTNPAQKEAIRVNSQPTVLTNESEARIVKWILDAGVNDVIKTSASKNDDVDETDVTQMSQNFMTDLISKSVSDFVLETKVEDDNDKTSLSDLKASEADLPQLLRKIVEGSYEDLVSHNSSASASDVSVDLHTRLHDPTRPGIQWKELLHKLVQEVVRQGIVLLRG